jgi:hypothetical protein
MTGKKVSVSIPGFSKYLMKKFTDCWKSKKTVTAILWELKRLV